MNDSLNYNNKMKENSDSDFDDVLIEDKQEFILVANEDDKKCNICNSYTFVMVIFLIETIISMGIFYICYILEFAKLYQVVLIIIQILFVLIYFFIPLFIRLKFFRNNKKRGNLILFILISINKILLFIFIHLFAVSYSNKRLEFPNFEARFYFKASFCLFYLFLIFFSYFRKDSKNFGIFYYISFASISFIAMFLLIFFTYQNEDKWEIEGLYIILSSFELISTITGIYMEKNNTSDEDIYEFNKVIEWKINKIDFYKFGYLLVSILYFGCKVCCIESYKKGRCCKKFINNFSLPSHKRNIFSQSID